MIYKCIIVDDEPPAQRVIERFLKDIHSMKIIAKCGSAFEANELLTSEHIDIMFLDINMPKMTGLSFLKTLSKPPTVIITSAYREYALEGYELDVVDYLKKPFSFERFYKAVNKAMEKIKLKKLPCYNSKTLGNMERMFLFVKEDKITYKIYLKDILYIESIGDYNKIYTTEKPYLTYQTLKKLHSLLPGNIFPRVHKSFIISLHKIENIIGNCIRINNRDIPIGQKYRKPFLNLINELQ